MPFCFDCDNLIFFTRKKSVIIDVLVKLKCLDHIMVSMLLDQSDARYQIGQIDQSNYGLYGAH